MREVQKMSTITNQMAATVLVIGTGEKDIVGGFTVKQKAESKLFGSFDYKPVIDSAILDGSIVVKRNDCIDLAGSISIRPNNHMTGTVNVVEPPIKRIQSEPIKDATLASNAPYLQFGQGSELVAGKVSNKEDYRAILAFDVPAINQIDLDNLVYAKIQLTAIRPIQQATTLTLYTTSRSDWSETGVNWANQPAFSKEIATTDVAVGAKSIVFDLASYFSQDATSGQVMSFVIRDTSGELMSIPITFGSRETSDAPILDYAWNWFPPSAGLRDLAGSFTPRFKKGTDLTGSLIITKGLYGSNIEGSLDISKKHADSKIAGTIVVLKRSAQEIIGSLDITAKHLDLEIDGSIVVKQKSQENLHGSITIEGIDKESILDGSIIVKQKDKNDISGSVSIVEKYDKCDLNGSIVVKRNLKNDLAGSIDIITINESHDLSGSIVVRAFDSTSLKGSLILKSTKIEKDIIGSISVKAYGEKSIDGSLDIIEKHKEVDIVGGLTVKQYDLKEIEGSIIVKQHQFNEIVGTLTSRPKWGEDIEGSVVVVHDVADDSYAFIM
jgi:hypothetical protein